MNWQKRLRDMAIAGGLAGGAAYGYTACFWGNGCNGNSDPCCGDPGGAACQAEQACESNPTEACCIGDHQNRVAFAQGPCEDAGFGFVGTGGSSSSGGTGGSSSSGGTGGSSSSGGTGGAGGVPADAGDG
jgi:hypothetical protein